MPGCPINWDDAKKWTDLANGERDELTEPVWRWDCGFKLDFDGPIIRSSSRFYPPKTHYGPKWDGNVTLLLLGEIICNKSFEEDTLLELHDAVEAYKVSIVERLKRALEGFNTGAEQKDKGNK